MSYIILSQQHHQPNDITVVRPPIIINGGNYGNYGNYGSHGCCGHNHNNYNQYNCDESHYEKISDTEFLGTSIRELGSSIANLIVTCHEAKQGKTETSDSTTSKTENTSNNKVREENEQLKKEIAELKTLLEDLKDGKVDSPSDKANSDTTSKPAEPSKDTTTGSATSSNKTEDVNSKPTVDESKNDKPVEKEEPKQEPVNTKNINDLMQAASDANKVFYSSKNLEDQKAALRAYNAWAEAVVDPANNATPRQVDDCLRSMTFICAPGNNTSPYVASIMKESNELLDKLNELQRKLNS